MPKPANLEDKFMKDLNLFSEASDPGQQQAQEDNFEDSQVKLTANQKKKLKQKQKKAQLVESVQAPNYQDLENKEE